MKQRRKQQSGFTLIELSIVVTIIGILVAGALSLQTTILAAQKEAQTYSKMQFVIKAIDNFVDYYGYLPCPANPEAIFDAADFGIAQHDVQDTDLGATVTPTDETADVGTCPDNGTTNIIDTAANGVVLGAVPVHTLNIHPSYALDGWNNRITYVVDEDLTFRGNAQTLTGGGVFERGTLVSGGVPISYTTGNADGTSNNGDAASDGIANDDSRGNIILRNNTGTTNMRDDIAVLLLSHGANGLGAWPGRGGARLGTAGITAEEGENTNDDNIFRQNHISPTMDDIIYYKTKWQIDASRCFTLGVTDTISCN